MLVWLAIMSPLTLCGESTYGDLRDSATCRGTNDSATCLHCSPYSLRTWMLAGPHGMKFASLRSLIRCSALCTYTGNTSSHRIHRAHDHRTAYLCGVDCALNYVENRDVATLARRGRHHDIFSLRMGQARSGHKSQVSVACWTTVTGKAKPRNTPCTHLQQSSHDI